MSTIQKRPVIAVLASGGGTTAEAFVRANATGKIRAGVGLVICNNPKAGIFDRIEALNKELGLHIKTLLINSKTHPAEDGEFVSPGGQTRQEEAAILRALKAGTFDLFALMGYMKRVGPRLVHEFGWRPQYTSVHQARLVNTHPGLLPETKGLYGIHVQEHVLKHGLTHGGQTLHVVAEDYDDGPVIAEHRVPVEADDTAESFFDRVQQVEKKFLPLDIDAFIEARTAVQ